jgi:hypothetical protein
MIVLNWSQSENWLMQIPSINGPEIFNNYIYYYFIGDTGTNVIWIPHPRWLAINGGLNKWIETIFDVISAKKIFDIVSERSLDEFKTISMLKEQSIGPLKISKREYLFHLSQFLNKYNMKMSGSELVEHFRRNSITTDYGTSYVGGRGVYKFISSVYNFYAGKGEQEYADSIARAFVKQDGTYAYI